MSGSKRRRTRASVSEWTIEDIKKNFVPTTIDDVPKDLGPMFDPQYIDSLNKTIDKVSGMTTAVTAGKKDDSGKEPISLIPIEFILGTARVFEFGGKKYGKHNFRNGLNHSRCLDAAARHLFAIMRGEDIDPESGLPHAYHLACSVAMYDWQRLHHPELDDRYGK